MANKEAPNTLLSDGVLHILDLVCEGPISGFLTKPGPYGTDPLVSTYYDDVPVRNLDGSYNFGVTGANYSFGYTLGTSAQTGIPGFQKAESLIPLSSNTRIANPPEGAGPVKPVIVAFTSNTYPDADAIRVTVRVPALMAQDAENNTNPFEIQYAVDISINNGLFVPVGLETILGKCTSTYQKTTTYTLPKSTPAASFYEWKVRVRRVSQNILSIRTQNEILVDSIAIVSTSLYAYPNTVLVGTKIGADQFGSIPARAYEIAGLLVNVPAGYTPTTYGYSNSEFTRQCDVEIDNKHIGLTTPGADQTQGIVVGVSVSGPGIPAGSVVVSVAPPDDPTHFTIDQDPTATANNVTLTFTPVSASPTITPAVYPPVWMGNYTTGVWTDNPAWIFNDLLTNTRYGLGDHIPASTVDKWTLYKISQYCDRMVDDGAGGLEPMFTCNVVITQPQEAYTVLLNLASTFRGMLYYANGTIRPIQNQDEPPVYAFNNSNVVDGVFNYSDTAHNTRATVAVVKWVDPLNSYRENVEYVEDVEGILRYGYQEKQMTAFACTSRGQAYRLGSWTLETERLLTETVTFQTSLEGLSIQPGDSFAVYDNFRNNRNQAGRISSFQPSRSVITVDRPVAIDAGYTYSLSAIVPKAQIDDPALITDSSQIDLIRQSQVESFEVVTAPTESTQTLTIAGQFGSGLFVGSPFVLAISGNSNIFRKATFYTCLATAETEPGKIEVLGLEANTGVQFVIQTGYTVIDYPDNPGDGSAIQPPSNLFVTGITGMTEDNTFFSSINLTWDHTPSVNLSHYRVSGKEWDTPYEGFNVFANEFNFTRGDTGQYLFRVAAVSLGGRESTYITGGLLIDDKNPLGTLRPLTGVRLIGDYDPLYVNSSGAYTGYIGTTPTFAWSVPVDENDNPIVDAQFISGFRVSLKSFDGLTDYVTPFDIEGVDNTTYQIPAGTIYGFAGGPQRGFDFRVQTLDIYGGVFDGGSLKVNNPPMKPPFASGFVGIRGGVIYNVTPSIQYDTSGIYLWANANPSFTPTFANSLYSSTNLAAVAMIAPNTGTFYTWFSLTDTFGADGNAIYGPISGNTVQAFDPADLDISAEINAALESISGAFAQLTGLWTDRLDIVSGEGFLNAQAVNGLSGQIIGTTNGTVNTALTVRMDSITLSSSGALSQQIDAVRATTQTTGELLTAQVGTVRTALTNSGIALGEEITVATANYQAADGNLSTRVTATGATILSTIATSGGALAEWITNLGVQTSGQSSSVQVGARAFVTGDVNGIGGAAVAAWGFKLNANNKVVSMQATSEDWGAGSSEFGTIVFGGATVQSDTFSAGSNGWRLQPGGNAEFNDIIARGEFSAGSFPNATAITSAGVVVGNPSAERLQLLIGSAGNRVFQSFNSSNAHTTSLGNSNIGGQQVGSLFLNDSVGSSRITATALNGGTISIEGNGAGGVFFVGSSKTLHFHNTSNGTYLTEANGLQLWGDGSHPIQVKGGDLNVDNDVSAATFTTTSSRRFKQNITPLLGALATIESLSGVRFDWRTRDVQNDFGLIAEDVAPILPTAVTYDRSGNVQGVDYGRITSVLIEAVKDLSAEVKALKEGR